MKFIDILFQNETQTVKVNIWNTVATFYSVIQLIFLNDQIIYNTENASTFSIIPTNLKSTCFLYSTTDELIEHLENVKKRFPIVKLCIGFSDNEVINITYETEKIINFFI